MLCCVNAKSSLHVNVHFLLFYFKVLLSKGENIFQGKESIFWPEGSVPTNSERHLENEIKIIIIVVNLKMLSFIYLGAYVSNNLVIVSCLSMAVWHHPSSTKV